MSSHVTALSVTTSCSLLGRASPALRGSSSLPGFGDDGRRRGSSLVVRAEEEDEFETRLSRLRKKGGSGTGKKAEERKMRKEGSSSDAAAPGSLSSSAVKPLESLPPVPLQDPISGGLPVVVGFSPYSERLNGQAAALGLVALLSIELYTGESLFQYHDGATLFVQLYVLAGLGALVVKLEKEKSSVWPN